LPKALVEREERAALVRSADERLGEIVAKLKRRGIRHPYVKNFVLARTTPLTRARKTLPSFDVTFRKLVENMDGFDVGKVRYDEVARSATMAPPAAG
jgi:ParB family chromosome partitioning protein